MELPSFVDFMATLDEETIEGIFKDANNASKIPTYTKGIQPDNIPGLQMQLISYQISLELLAVYHKWLERQL